MQHGVLRCTVCHTVWTERYLWLNMKCPFRDCAGHLSFPPAPPRPPTPRKTAKTYPLLEAADKANDDAA